MTVRITDIADGVTRQVERLGDSVSETLFEPVIRLGVTGLSRAGKTVFITSLVANLLDRGRMGQLSGASTGTIQSVFLRPQPDDTVPRFDYETHLGALAGDHPEWPSSTRSVSELRLSFRVQPRGMLSALSGPRTVHLDIVDYPGEWLLDVGLMDLSYADWAEQTLSRLPARPDSDAYLNLLSRTDPNADFDEVTAKALATAFATHLVAARAAGMADCTPGRFLLPGDLAGSPVLTFAPLPRPDRPARGSLWRECERRFEAYKREVVKPFFRDHFARINRQIVLVDVLDALHAGPPAVEELRRAMAGILSAFRPGKDRWLSRLITGQKVDRILFAATKADHLHHSQHARLTAITEALVRDARDRADFSGARTSAMAIAALRATVEDQKTHGGQVYDCVRGRVEGADKVVTFYAGDLPTDPARILTPARQGQDGWLNADYASMHFAPPHLDLEPGDGPPHIRLDRAAQFLFGDDLT